MLAFKVWRGEVLSKTFESFLLSPTNPILNKFGLTHTLKIVQKVDWKILKKYETKLDNIWGTTEKESSHLDLYLKSYSQLKFWSNSVFKIKQKRKRFKMNTLS